MTDRRADSPDPGAMIAATNAAMIWPDCFIVCGVILGAATWHLSGQPVSRYVIPGAMIAAGLIHAAAILWAVWMSRRMIVDNRNTSRHSSRQGGMPAPDEQPPVDEHMIKGVKT